MKPWITIIAGLYSIIFVPLVYGSEVTRSSGGSIRTDLGYNVVLNKESSLEREWITIHDDTLPVDIVGTTGTTVIYGNSEYNYKSEYSIITKEPVAAIEIRFLTFDLWGNLIQTLTATEIVDLKAGETRNFTGQWSLYSENQASEYYASIAFIAQVRTSAGKVVRPNLKIALDEARKFSSKFAESDLDPKPTKK